MTVGDRGVLEVVRVGDRGVLEVVMVGEGVC